MSSRDGSHKQLLAAVGSNGLNEVRWMSNHDVLFDMLPIGRPGGALDHVDATTRRISRVGRVDELPGDGVSFVVSHDRTMLALTTRCDGSCSPHVPVMVGVVPGSGGTSTGSRSRTRIAFTGVPLTGKGVRNGVYVIGADGRGLRRLA